MIPVVVMTDGRRDCIARSIASMDMLQGAIGARVIHDDSGDLRYQGWLREQFGDWQVISTRRRSGFADAYTNARAWVTAEHRADFYLFTEDDFVFTRPVDLDGMAEVLRRRQLLTQMALRRQPWNAQEKAAGGIVEQYPDDYTEHTLEGWSWLEHRRFVTTNPALWPAWSVALPWPSGSNSEGRFGYELFASEPHLHSAFWGARDSGEWCEHIGVQRVGTGY